MKEFYINNKRVTLPENIYFPFTQKISDLEDITIIGLPASKSITIPYSPDNDEIFGNIAQITRIAYGSNDDKIGVSFNQIKKTSYKLYLNNVIISEGIIKLIDITSEGYVVELYDKLIDLIETFEGNDDTGAGFLNELDLRIGSTTFNKKCIPSDIKYHLDTGFQPTPHVNINDYEYNGKEIYCNNIPSSGPAFKGIRELQIDMTPMQVRSIKAQEFEFSVSISNVINSINYKYDNIITYDTNLNVLLASIHMNLGKPKPIPIVENWTIDTTTLGSVVGYSLGTTPTPLTQKFQLNSSGVNIAKNNGKYKLKIPIEITMYPTGNIQTKYFGGGIRDGVVFGPFDYSNISSDVYLGSLYLGFSIGGFSNLGSVKEIESNKTFVEIPLYVDQTISVNFDYGTENITDIFIYKEIEIDLDYYFDIYDAQTTLSNYLIIDYSKLFYLNVDNYTRGFMDDNYPGYSESQYTMVPTLNEFVVNRTYSEIRTGDPLNGKSLFPKIPIKTFLLAVSKYFNLSIQNKDGKLHFSKKLYSKTGENLLIDEIIGMQPLNFDFSKLLINTNVGKNDLIDEYEKIYNLSYGTKVINTGYNIKNTVKKITFDVGIPVPYQDVNSYAYGVFADYLNNGYKREFNGITTGLENVITFGYPYRLFENIWATRDSCYEANMFEINQPTPQKKEWIHCNRKLNYNVASGKYIYQIDSAINERMSPQHNTFIPFLIGSGGTITSSLEFYKSKYNYAGITDAQYPDSATMYNTYFKKLIEDIYSVNTHILNVRLFIDGKFDIYKIYNHNNSLYRIIEITEYDPTEPGLYEVKLQRINNINNYI